MMFTAVCNLTKEDSDRLDKLEDAEFVAEIEGVCWNHVIHNHIDTVNSDEFQSGDLKIQVVLYSDIDLYSPVHLETITFVKEGGSVISN